MATPLPDLKTPLVRDGGGENVSDVVKGLGPLVGLIGTWNSPASPPLGYNVMPLPEATASNKYILKDFSYYEEMTFSAIAGNVPRAMYLIAAAPTSKTAMSCSMSSGSISAKGPRRTTSSTLRTGRGSI